MIFALVFALLLAPAAGVIPQQTHSAKDPLIGKPAPPIKADEWIPAQLSGKGKVVMIDFWATWCGPCKVEIPIFNELYAQYKDQGLVILGVSVDDDEPTLKEFVKQTPMTYPVLLAAGQEEFLEAAGPVYGYPTSFFIDRSGAVCGKHIGIGTKESFEASIKPLL